MTLNQLLTVLRLKPKADPVAAVDLPQEPAQATIAVMGVFLREHMEEKRREARWAKIKTAGFLVFLLALLGYYVFIGNALFGLGAAGGSAKPEGDLLAIVRVHGPISRDADASAARINIALREAFEDVQVKKVVLSIDSPGGSPVEAERITSAISYLREKHQKPVVAVIGNVGASAAYMVAMETDTVVSGRFSLVGSIGAVLQAWDFHRLMERNQVGQKTFASGDLKAMLNPFAPGTKKADDKAQELVDVLGKQFLTDLQTKRKGKLAAGVAFDSGEVWNGSVAKDIGLVDANGTLDSFAAAMPELTPHDFGPFPQRSLLSRLGLSAAVEEGVAKAVARMTGAHLEIH